MLESSVEGKILSDLDVRGGEGVKHGMGEDRPICEGVDYGGTSH